MMPAREADVEVTNFEEPLAERLQGALKRQRPKLKRVFRKFRMRPEDAEEVLQDALLAAIKTQRCGEVRDLDAWLLVVVRYRCQHFWRREFQARKVFVGADALSEVRAQPAPSVDPVLRVTLQQALGDLSRKDLRIVLLKLQGLSPAEVARRMGCQKDSIRKLYARALERLQRRIDGRQHLDLRAPAVEGE